MKKLISVLCVLAVLVAALCVTASAEETANWAYGALPLNSEDAGVGTIYYAAAYFEIEGITNPVTAAPYTEEEIAAIVNQEAEGEYIEAPEGAMIGMSVFGAEDSIFWYDADNAAAIVSHADPLAMNTETGMFATAEGEEVAAPMTTANWAYGALPMNSEDAGVGTIYYAAAYFEIEGITNPVTAAPYTEEEIAAIVNQEAEGEYIEAPEGAMIGMSVFGAEDSIFWYDADNAAAIVSHADPLAMNAETGVFATAEGEEVAVPMTTANWAYGALPMNSEDAGVGTIYYAAAYFEIEGITNPVTAAPYTEEEIAAIVNQEAEGEYIEAPEGAMIGMSVFGAEDSIFWYDADNAAAIVSHADPLAMNAETGVFATAEGEEVAAPMA